MTLPALKIQTCFCAFVQTKTRICSCQTRDMNSGTGIHNKTHGMMPHIWGSCWNNNIYIYGWLPYWKMFSASTLNDKLYCRPHDQCNKGQLWFLGGYGHIWIGSVYYQILIGGAYLGCEILNQALVPILNIVNCCATYCKALVSVRLHNVPFRHGE